MLQKKRRHMFCIGGISALQRSNRIKGNYSANNCKSNGSVKT